MSTESGLAVDAEPAAQNLEASEWADRAAG
jgi:hypothetical protein